MKLVRSIVAVCTVALLATQVQAGFISINAANTVSSVEPTVVALADGVNVYHDRDPGHRLWAVPEAFEDNAEVVVTSNSDKTNPDYQLGIDVNQLSVLYVGIDTRFLDQQPFDWMNDTSVTGLPTVFFDTGAVVNIDEGTTLEDLGTSPEFNDDGVPRAFRLWATIAPEGSYTLKNQDVGGGSNNYIVIADNKVIPEPGSIALLGMGLVGLVGLIRRRK